MYVSNVFTTFVLEMNRLKGLLVWIRRIGHCRGFGIQSPAAYWLVRYVINEHWLYYQYTQLGKNDDWLTQKLGRLHFRLSNWRQPEVITSNCYQEYLQAGCKKSTFGDSNQLVCMKLGNNWREQLALLYNKVDAQTVLIIEDIWRNKEAWHEIVADEHTSITFDLYYCGLVMFDKKRTKQHYIINF